MDTDEFVSNKIHLIRGRKVMLDVDLADLYGVRTKRFNEQVKRNIQRFPEDFMFRLSKKENDDLRSQFATSSSGYGGRRYLPYAFTEHGVVMLSAVLNSEKAIEMSIFISRAFIKMREYLDNYKDLSTKINRIESTQREQGDLIHSVHQVIKHLIDKPEEKKDKIGFNN